MRFRDVATRTLHHAYAARFGLRHRERTQLGRVYAARRQPAPRRSVRISVTPMLT